MGYFFAIANIVGAGVDLYIFGYPGLSLVQGVLGGLCLGFAIKGH